MAQSVQPVLPVLPVVLEDNAKLGAEYEALRNGVALLDLSATAKLTIGGKNAVQFINGLVSNDVKSLEPGQGVFACFPNLQGKVAALAHIYRTAEYLLFELDASNRAKIFKNLSRFVPAGEFFLSDVTDELALLSLQGPQAAALLQALTGVSFAEVAAHSITPQTIAGIAVQVAQRARAFGSGFDLYVPAAKAAQVMDAMLAQGEAFTVRQASIAALDIARLEAGLPQEPVDVNENFIINETNLTEAVSYTKGCYLGQEVIARIHWRGQPAKQLRGLLVDADQPPAPGTELWAGDGKRIGEITSSVMSIALQRVIAFGYVHRYYLTGDQTFTLKNGEQALGTAQLSELPFLKP